MNPNELNFQTTAAYHGIPEQEYYFYAEFWHDEYMKRFAGIRRMSKNHPDRVLVIVSTYGWMTWRAEFYDSLPEAQAAFRNSQDAFCIARNGVIIATKNYAAIVQSENPPVEEQPEPEWHEPGYIGDGFTNEYDYDHPVHGNALREELDAEYDTWLDGLRSDLEPEFCECGHLIHTDGSHHADCACCPDCGRFPCRCKRQDAAESDEDDARTLRVDRDEDDWKGRGGYGGGNPEADLDAPDSDDEIAAIVGRIRDYQAQAEDIAEKVYALKDRLELLLKKRGTNWSDDDGYARLTAPGVRANYNLSALDALIINDPLRYGWLKDYRKESALAARVMVK